MVPRRVRWRPSRRDSSFQACLWPTALASRSGRWALQWALASRRRSLRRLGNIRGHLRMYWEPAKGARRLGCRRRTQTRGRGARRERRRQGQANGPRSATRSSHLAVDRTMPTWRACWTNGSAQRRQRQLGPKAPETATRRLGMAMSLFMPGQRHPMRSLYLLRPPHGDNQRLGQRLRFAGFLNSQRPTWTPRNRMGRRLLL